MNTTGIICIVVCIAIFVGTIEQARLVLRQKTWPPKANPVEAKRNTLRGELSSLLLGVNQVQGYIDFLKGDKTTAAIQVIREACDGADKGLTRARELHKQVSEALPQADSENAVQICALKLDTARLYVRRARAAVEHLAEEAGINGFDDEDGEDNSHN
jgi:hypothetical protein